MQIGDDDASAGSGNPGHFRDGLMRRWEVAQSKRTKCQIGCAVGKRNVAGIGEAETPGKLRLAGGFKKHLRAEIETKDLRAALLSQRHPAARTTGNVEKAGSS